MAEADSTVDESCLKETDASNDSKETSSKEGPVADDLTAEGKNLKYIKCRRCPSTILLPEMASLVSNDFKLPDIKMQSGETQVVTDEQAKKYWCVNNMYDFENVGFSKTVDGIKYLICADCEIGPIGWHDLNSKLSYVSVSRITYSLTL